MTEFTYGTDVNRGTGTEPPPRRAADIESDIHQTRERLGNEIEAIGDKLSPSHIKQRATAAVRRKSRNVLRTARENPLPSALIALGVALLVRGRRTGTERFDANGGGTAHELKEKAQHAVSAAGEKVEHVAQDAADRARRTGMTLERFFERTPIIAGAGAMVLGAAVGALIPRTEKENQLMGPKRDELVQKAKSVAHHTQDAVQQRLEGGSNGSTQRQH